MLLFSLWIFTTFFAYFSLQVSDPNCLRSHPDVLDGDFVLFNRYHDVWNVTEEDVAKQVGLITTRYNHIHDFFRLNSSNLKLIGNGVSRYTISSKKNVNVFLSLGNEADTLDEVILLYKESYEFVKKINSGNEGPVVGLYLADQLPTLTEELEAVDTVFGSKENFTFPLGHHFSNCLYVFNDHSVKYLQRLNFISCRLHPAKRRFPEKSADDVITRCDKLRDVAASINITAEIKCAVAYPSHGRGRKGIIGSLARFQKFWCRIVNEMARNKSHVEIIMLSAFDPTPYDDYENDEDYLRLGVHHRGWWRRRHTTSYDASAFVEKVDELEGGREDGNCSAECSHCSWSDDCCDGRTCEFDFSYQPFEQKTPHRVCQSALTTCAPRPPRITNGGSVVAPLSMAVLFIVCSPALRVYSTTFL